MLNQKVEMTCGACLGEGRELVPVLVGAHEDATDWNDAEEADLCGYCYGDPCSCCGASGKVLVLV